MLGSHTCGSDWAESVSTISHLIRLDPDELTEEEFEAAEYALDNPDPAELKKTIKTKFSTLLNTEIVLGETHYTQLDGAPYDHAVRTFINRGPEATEFGIPIWRNETFFARWSLEGDVVRFVTDSKALGIEEYFYQNNTPGELVTTNRVVRSSHMGSEGEFFVENIASTKLISNDRNKQGILGEAASTGFLRDLPEGLDSIPIESLIEDSHIFLDDETGELSINDEKYLYKTHALYQGQMDIDGGYAAGDGYDFESYKGDDLVSSYIVRESFNRIGDLLAGEGCNTGLARLATTICTEEDIEPYGPVGSVVTDSIHYFPPEDFDSLTSIQDAIRWEVQGVPANTNDIAVVSAEASIELSERELLCRGYQYVHEFVNLFCTATDEQLANTTVVELDAGIPSREIPGASLVQAQ